ncbi:MAG: hypothetical protein Fur0026_03040 [Sideroxydans sp.]
MKPFVIAVSANSTYSISSLLFRQGLDATLDFFCTLFVFSVD